MSTKMDDIIARLKQPFPFEEIECKVQATTNDKAKGLAVFYINSRAIQNRLDEVVGPLKWENKYEVWQDKSQICGISIYDDDRSEWVTKYDGAENTDYEPIKGGLSDAFKRAAVMWGLGRYLYDIDGLWADVEQRGKSTVIKGSEKNLLRDHYNRFVGNPASGNTTKQPQQSDTDAQQGKSANTQPKQNTGETHQNPQQHEIAGAPEYKIHAADDNGSSTCLTLLNKEGKQFKAYVPKDSPGIKKSAFIKDSS